MKWYYKTWFYMYGVLGWVCILISIIFALADKDGRVLICYNEFNEIYIELVFVIGIIVFMLIYLIKELRENERV